MGLTSVGTFKGLHSTSFPLSPTNNRQSGTFPLCDGAHMKHNEATGDNVGPLIVSTPKPST
jgi:hypothetical protein